MVIRKYDARLSSFIFSHHTQPVSAVYELYCSQGGYQGSIQLTVTQTSSPSNKRCFVQALRSPTMLKPDFTPQFRFTRLSRGEFVGQSLHGTISLQQPSCYLAVASKGLYAILKLQYMYFFLPSGVNPEPSGMWNWLSWFSVKGSAPNANTNVQSQSKWVPVDLS